MREKEALEVLKDIPLYRMEKNSSKRSELGEAFFSALDALEAKIKLKECINRLNQPEYENITWSKEELVLLLEEIAKGVTRT